VYNENRNRTFFFWNEEWRRLIQGSSPSISNAILASDFPTAGAPLAYTIPTGGPTPSFQSLPTQPNWPSTRLTDLTAGKPFPGNVIPANLIDPELGPRGERGNLPEAKLQQWHAVHRVHPTSRPRFVKT
jgi:hypothetical protein